MSTKSELELYKILERRKQKLRSYYKCKPIKNFEYKDTRDAKKKRVYREKKSESRENEKLRKRKYREALKSSKIIASTSEIVSNTFNFNNRTSKHRAVKRMKQALPLTPERRSATVAAYLKNSKSPTVKLLQSEAIISTPEDQMEISTERAALKDIKSAIDTCKMKRSKDSTVSMNVLVASVSGENVTKSKCRKSLAKKLGLPVRRISKGHKIRTTILHSEKSCWTYTCRKTRSDAIRAETKRIAYEFWMKPGISRPSGNKSDVKRERIGPKTYSSHMVHLLEKTQTEVYLDFIGEYPSVNISQRSFENCKPYFIRQVRPKDRQTCCCRYHIEIKTVFKSCMEFRKKMLDLNETNDETPVYESVGDIVDITLCKKQNDAHNMSCLRRSCEHCGIDKLVLLPDEIDNSETAKIVKWEKFEKVDIKSKGNKTLKKLMLVKKETKVGELFSHFRELLKSFPLHQHRATWQNKQFQTLVTNLPKNHCVCIHDFSENYRCTDLKEIQSAYFQKTEVSVHVTIIHRHAILEYDGVESSAEFPELITEHFFVISDDQQHDQHYVHEVRRQISEYLKSISYTVDTMHEFTDGCAAQYKSRHCFGDISNSCKDFGWQSFTRNFFETAHAKGPQDAAGGLLKRQADLAVLRGQSAIRCAYDLFNFATANLVKTKSFCKRRIFRYVETIPRETNLQFKPVSKIRVVHQVLVRGDREQIAIRELTCFSCDKCSQELYDECENITNTGEFTEIKMVNDLRSTASDIITEEQEIDSFQSMSDLVSEGHVIAVVADDNEQEFFLMKVKESSHVLKTETTDAWGATLPSGTAIISGLYYDNTKTNPLTYKLVQRKNANVPAKAVIYICAEIDASVKIKLQEEIYLNILQSINDLKFLCM